MLLVDCVNTLYLSKKYGTNEFMLRMVTFLATNFCTIP